jgi:ketosteroid isomerase-like protein
MSREAFQATNRIFEEEVVGRGDFGALARVYTADARLIPPGAPAMAGLPAITEYWKTAAAALGVTAVRLHTLELTVFEDRAQELGRAELTLAAAPEPVEVKYVVLWKREGDTWKWDVDIFNMST